MKKTAHIFLMLLMSLTIAAQPSPVKKAAKSVFTLTSFNDKGEIVASAQGVFIDEEGTGLCPFKPFVGAERATVIDAEGNSMEVDALLGADELYDVAKLRVKASTKAAPLPSKAEQKGAKAWLVPYSIKDPKINQLSISSVEKFHTSYNYYLLQGDVPDNATGCPVVNASGQVVGIMLKSGEHTTAIDAAYINQLSVNGLSSLDASLQETGVRTALPDKEEEALTMMTLKKGSVKKDTYKAYVDEFLAKFPTSAFGYHEKGLMQVENDLFEEADKTMQTALKQSAAKDEVHSDYANLIYQKVVYKADKPYEPWTLEKALQETKTAYQLNPQPVYRHQEAQIIFSQGKYQEAYDIFMELTKSPISNAELYYEAAQSKMRLQAPDTEIRVLLDSAVNVGKRMGTGAAPYILARAQYLHEKGAYREALKDYNAYDTLTVTTDPAFFYMRYKCEMQVRQWQQALFDIARASFLNPKEPTYFAEWASLDLRVKRYDEAISAANKCIELAPEYADGYLLLGLAQIEKGLKEEGLKNLEKAKELGDTRAEKYIEKNK